MKELNDQAVEILKKYLESGLCSWETFLEMKDNTYSIKIEKLSNRRVAKLKSEGYL